MASRLAASLALLFLLGSVAVLIAVAVVQVHKTSYESAGMRYGMVLDAGSSRTTLYLYQWPAEKENDTGVVNRNSGAWLKVLVSLALARTQLRTIKPGSH
ncbi:hypothetical protein AGOR_G00206260 [Albula goreensis]|uniref:Uncharacterized protein n=1 Tax=Albula goreensis TaxID=1534307 RepID=A0A8T3CSL9_9TELE|nr:hypothetical protein AGOR_G00206260 [Albula goreensis]